MFKFSCFVSFLTLFSVSNLAAQIVNLSGADGRPIMMETRNDIDGKPYLKEEFSSARLVLKNDPKEKEAFGRLNFLNKSFEFKNDGKLLEVPFSDIEYLFFDGESQEFRNGKSFKLESNNLYLVLYQGQNMALFQEFNYKLSEGQVNSYSGGEAKRKIMETEILYLIIANKPAEVRRNKKSFLSVLPDNLLTAANEYLKKNKISWSDNNQLIQFVDDLDLNF
jgi:hypothetical protein